MSDEYTSAGKSGGDTPLGSGAGQRPYMPRATIDAVAAWLKHGAQGRAPCVMSPMDEMAWFNTPVVTYPVQTAFEAIQLCQANSERVLLLLCCPTGAGQIAPDPQIDQGASTSLALNTTVPYLLLTQKEHGVLCQTSWYGHQNGTVVPVQRWMVIEVTLKDWPR